MLKNIEIAGGAGPSETAAISAIIAAIEDEERLAAAVRPKPILQSEWMRTGRPLEHLTPISSKETAKAEYRKPVRMP